MEENTFRETDLPDRLLETLLSRLGAEDPAAACELVRTGLRERLRMVFDALPVAEHLAEVLRTKDKFPARNDRKEGASAPTRSEKDAPTDPCRAGNDRPSAQRAQNTATETSRPDSSDSATREKPVERLLIQPTGPTKTAAPPASTQERAFRGKDDSTSEFPGGNQSFGASRAANDPSEVCPEKDRFETDLFATLAKDLFTRLAVSADTLPADKQTESCRTRQTSSQASDTENPASGACKAADDSDENLRVKEKDTPSCDTPDNVISTLLEKLSEGLLVALAGTPHHAVPSPEINRAETSCRAESPAEAGSATGSTDFTILAKLLGSCLIPSTRAAETVVSSSVDNETAGRSTESGCAGDAPCAPFRRGADSAEGRDAGSTPIQPGSAGKAAGHRQEVENVISLFEQLLLLRTLKNRMQ